MREEAARAARICAKSKQAVVSMFQEARMGKAVDARAIARHWSRKSRIPSRAIPAP